MTLEEELFAQFAKSRTYVMPSSQRYILDSSLELLRSSIGVEDEDPSVGSGVLTEELLDPSASSGALMEELLDPSASSGVLKEELLDPSASSGALTEELLDPSASSGALTEELLDPSAGSGVLIEEEDESISTHVPLVQRRGFSLSAGLISKPSLPASHGISVPCCGGKLEPPFSLFALLALSSPHPQTKSEDATSKKHKCNFFILPPGNMNPIKLKLHYFLSPSNTSKGFFAQIQFLSSIRSIYNTKCII